MATTRDKFIARCDEIYNAQPTYKHGASDLNECDCIGMIKYSLRKNGVSFSTTGSNYTARNNMEDFREIHSASDLKRGDVVFKAIEPGESGYDLPAKYKQGGSGYNGDLRDYNHIGIVRSVNPLEIEHMTSPSAKRDPKVGRWRFTGSLKKNLISDDAPDPGPEPTPPTPTSDTAVVWAEKGETVNMRKSKSTGAALVERVPIGWTVKVLENDGTWAKIAYTDKRHATWYGYMMTQFLKFEEEPVGDLVSITIDDISLEEAQALKEKYPNAQITVG